MMRRRDIDKLPLHEQSKIYAKRAIIGSNITIAFAVLAVLCSIVSIICKANGW